jgi:hypothetical protein
MLYLALNKLKVIKCWKGIRYSLGLPCRGQRSHTNAKTISRLQSHVTAPLKSQQLQEAKAKFVDKVKKPVKKQQQVKKNLKKNKK